jgi:hypothetical protein
MLTNLVHRQNRPTFDLLSSDLLEYPPYALRRRVRVVVRVLREELHNDLFALRRVLRVWI